MKNFPLIILAVFLMAIFGFFIYKGGSLNGNLTQEELKTKMTSFISANLVNPGTSVEIKDIMEESGLYKLTIVLEGEQEVISYVTKNGEKFFPQMIDIAELEKELLDADELENAGQNPEIVKSDKPSVELFVMSYCPYGLQIEKGLLSALETLEGSIDFSLKFCSYAMHEKKEIDEQLRQYCIQEEEPEKLLPYLECFLAAGESENCLADSGIAVASLEKCVADTDKKFKVTENYKDKDSWLDGVFPIFDVFKSDVEKYGVEGSPTLIINGTEVETNRDSASLLRTICAAFNEQPSGCGIDLSPETPAPGFGFEGSGASTNASCE